MSHLAQLRQKIRSIQTTRKITHAVRVVSMSLYNKLDKYDDPLKNYTKDVKNFLIALMARVPGWSNTLLFPKDVFDTRPLHIVISTSKGLCGSLNSNLFRYVSSSLFIEKQQKPRFITVGTRASLFIKNKKYGDLAYAYSELSSNNYLALADELLNKIMNGSEQYTSVSFYVNETKSFLLQRPKKFTLIPMSLDPIVESDCREAFFCKNVCELMWEQDPSRVLDYFVQSYLRSSITQILFQAMRAEHAARFMAMENSTNNAEKYLERLTLQFNKMRQSIITKEVAELASGIQMR